jgi:hypothetical protein
MAYYSEAQESIYNLIPPEEVVREKPPMYRSKFNGKIPPSASTFGHLGSSHPAATNLAGAAEEKVVPEKAGRTFGKVPGMSRPHPQEFMKKNDKREPVAPLATIKREEPSKLVPSSLKVRHRPGVPKADEKPIMNLVTSKNFIVANAVETILAAPKKVSSGAKDFLNKEDFGKVPKYLKSIKADIEAESDYINHIMEQQEAANRSQVRPLSDAEREDMICGLKAKWEQINTDYQATTHLTKLDTIGKVKRKEKFEAELSQIEKDIERLSRKNIMVDRSM